MNKIIVAVAILLLGAVALFLIQGPLGSVGFESDGSSAPGELISVGTHNLHLYCIGKGSPTVLFEAGLGDWSLSWRTLQQQVSRDFGVRACAYDRAGYGWSEEGPQPRRVDRIADELILLLDNGNIEGEVVLVGHSLGGLISRVFASRYPHRVAGVILLDATPPGFRPNESQIQGVADYISWMETQLEELKANGPPDDLVEAVPDDQISPAIESRHHDIWRTQYMRALTFETNLSELLNNRGDNLDRYEITRFNSDIPLLVLVRDAPPEEFTQAVANYESWLFQQELQAQISANSEVKVVDGAGHYIYADKPHAVIDAIGDVLGKIR